MSDDIYEVERNEYAGFIGQLNKQKCEVEQLYEEDRTIINIKSKATNTLLCKRVIPESGLEQYYVYNMPADDERVAPKPVQIFNLETKEEVQAFFEILNKLQEHKAND